MSMSYNSSSWNTIEILHYPHDANQGSNQSQFFFLHVNTPAYSRYNRTLLHLIKLKEIGGTTGPLLGKEHVTCSSRDFTSTLIEVKFITWEIAGATNNLGSKASTTGCSKQEAGCSRRKHIIDEAKIKNLFSPKKRQIEGLPIIKKGRLMDSLLQNRAEKWQEKIFRDGREQK